MTGRWRYGLAVDLTVTAWALGACAIGVISISGIMRVGLGWPAVMIVLMGAGALVVMGIGAWLCIQTMWEGRGDGDVRRSDPD